MVKVVDLDFDTIKNSLISFLEKQSSIKDYDFAGSNINTLIELLSYNTYLNNFYTNMIANEMFLDTAEVRESIISHAKELNYIPKSPTGAKAIIDIIINPHDNPSSINIDKYTEFTSRIDNNVFTFTTDSDIVVTPTESNNALIYRANNVEIIEGKIINEFFEVTNDNFEVIISNEDVDISSIVVNIKQSETTTELEKWSHATSIFDINHESKIYFIEPYEANKYKIVFGDGIFGQKPKRGNIIELTYRNVNKANGNRARVFNLVSDISGYSNVNVQTVSESSGGSDRESDSSIKFNAPKSFQTQDRAVTSDDYEVIAVRQFPEIKNIAAYGGNLATPPRYGKVLLAVDLYSDFNLTDIKRKEIETFMDSKSPAGIQTIVVDPNYIDLKLDVIVNYDVTVTNNTINDITSKVKNAISQYNKQNLNKFNVKYRNSNILTEIDESDSSITSSQVNLKAIISIDKPLVESNYLLDFQNKLKKDSILTRDTRVDTYEPAVESTTFNYNNDNSARFIDNGNGVLSIVTGNVNFNILLANAGTIDYENGVVKINSILIDRDINFLCNLQEKDVIVNKETILRVNDSNVNINVVQSK